jgi:hypothetical protein
MMACNVDGCERTGRMYGGQCQSHYMMGNHRGIRSLRSPTALPPEQRLRRWLSRVELVGECWEWRGQQQQGGYGIVQWPRRRTTTAHRAIYSIIRGPVPVGLHLDHLCRNRACVNPDHLEPVTPGENTRRASAA